MEDPEEYLAEYEALLQKATLSNEATRASLSPPNSLRVEVTETEFAFAADMAVPFPDGSELDSVAKQGVASEFLAALQQEAPLAGESSLVEVQSLPPPPKSPTGGKISVDDESASTTSDPVTADFTASPPRTTKGGGYARGRANEQTAASSSRAEPIGDMDLTGEGSDRLEEELATLEGRRGVSAPTLTYGGVGISSTIVDLDIDHLAVQLEEQARVMSKAVVGRFVEVKRKLLLHETEVLEAERRQASGRLAAKQREVDSMRGEVVSIKRRMERMQAMVDKAASLVARRSQEKRAMRFLASVLWRWKGLTRQQRRTKLMLKKAVHFHDKSTLLRKSLRFWREETRLGQRQKTKQSAEALVSEEKRRLAAEHGSRIQQLQDALARAKGELALERQRREAQEENMKQAFMRGVCALNIEAMALMHKDKAAGAAGGSVEGGQEAAGPEPMPLQELNGPRVALGHSDPPEKVAASKAPATAAEWYLKGAHTSPSKDAKLVSNEASLIENRAEFQEEGFGSPGLPATDHQVVVVGRLEGDEGAADLEDPRNSQMRGGVLHGKVASMGRTVIIAASSEKVVKKQVKQESPRPRVVLPRPIARGVVNTQGKGSTGGGSRWM